MGGSRRVARLAYFWALIGCGVAPAAVAQEAAAASQPKTQIAAPATVQSNHSMWNSSDRSPAPAAAARTVSPWLPQPWKSADTPSNKFSLSDEHVIAVSTLTLILIGVIVILLAS